MRHIATIAWFVLTAGLAGCATKEFTFCAVNADTGRPLTGVHIYQRNVLTLTSTDQEHVLWTFDTAHPIPTGPNGIFKVSLDNAYWHVLVFRDQKSCKGPSENDHFEQCVTVSPKQSFVLIGDYPLEGKQYPPSGTITVKLQTYGEYWAWLRSPDNPGNKPAPQPSSRPVAQ